MPAPLLSIVTPCLNRAPLVAQAIESVQRQDYPRVEHIVMDGGSTDGTLEVLRRYPHLIVSSEKDLGLYDALNKAIQRARGEVIGHLNSDDLYEPRVFGAVMRAFAAHPEADAVVGGALTFEDTPGGAAVRQRYDPLTAQDFLSRATQGVIITNAWFYRRRVYDRIGLFSPDYALAADRDFLLRFWQAGCVFVPLNLPVYRYRSHGGSLTIGDQRSLGKVKLLDEYRRLAERLRRDAPEERLRSAALHWLRALALEKVIVLARNGRIGQAGAAAARQLAADPAWLFHVAGVLPKKVLGSCLRRIRGRRR
ncbi:MAG: glycosyltransferase family 2 protein [Candidatus Methylomirabilia bacterium]